MDGVPDGTGPDSSSTPANLEDLRLSRRCLFLRLLIASGDLLWTRRAERRGGFFKFGIRYEFSTLRKARAMIGKLVSAPIRLANAPARAFEKLVGDDCHKEDRVASKPLEKLAESVEEAIDGEDE